MKPCNPNRFTMSLMGVLINRGYADGEFFSAEPDSDTVLYVVGTDGEVATSVSYNNVWKASLKLLETSDGNKLLEQFWNLKKRGNGAVGFGAALFKDADTGESLSCVNCCVSRPPTITKDRTATAREWSLLLCDSELKYV
jgi:hypothetical protein